MLCICLEYLQLIYMGNIMVISVFIMIYKTKGKQIGYLAAIADFVV